MATFASSVTAATSGLEPASAAKAAAARAAYTTGGTNTGGALSAAQDALALPVIFAPGTETVYVEKGSWLAGLIPALKALGHAEVTPRALPLKANAIELRGSQAWGAADPRSEGKAVAE